MIEESAGIVNLFKFIAFELFFIKHGIIGQSNRGCYSKIMHPEEYFWNSRHPHYLLGVLLKSPWELNRVDDIQIYIEAWAGHFNLIKKNSDGVRSKYT